MALKVSTGISKKLGLPDYCSIGATCHVEFELDASLLQNDLESFQAKVHDAYVACCQAVSDEQLLAMLQRSLKEKPRTKCILRAHRGVPFRRVQEVLGVLARAGVWRIAYAVRDED